MLNSSTVSVVRKEREREKKGEMRGYIGGKCNQMFHQREK